MDFYTRNNLVTCWKLWANCCSAEEQENSCELWKHQMQCVCVCVCVQGWAIASAKWVVCREAARLQQHQATHTNSATPELPGHASSLLVLGCKRRKAWDPSKKVASVLISTSKTVPTGALRQNGASTSNGCITDWGQEGTEWD